MSNTSSFTFDSDNDNTDIQNFTFCYLKKRKFYFLLFEEKKCANSYVN